MCVFVTLAMLCQDATLPRNCSQSGFILTAFHSHLCLPHAPPPHPACTTAGACTPLLKDGLGTPGSFRQLSGKSECEAGGNICLRCVESWGSDSPIFLRTVDFSPRVHVCCLRCDSSQVQTAIFRTTCLSPSGASVSFD